MIHSPEATPPGVHVHQMYTNRPNTRAAIRSLLIGLAGAGYYAALLQVYLILR